ncbi:MAG: glycerophosphodiester phosphodiesterase family protein [Candidatus Omnitrophica bacterium]|nr:glycerophosphodiester phosphodiesterase family protein [Candidatus Omnitrophota bacterium]
MPLYEVEGKTDAGEAGGYVNAETGRVLIKVEKGKQPERLDRVLVAAHRGANRAAPENTLAAIRKAVEFGADLVEIDIRQTKDGRLVLMHNATLEKTTNGQGTVRDKTLEELKELDAGSWFGPEFQGERIPTLEEVFDELRGNAYPDFDLKSASPEVFVAALRAEREKTPDLFENSGLYCSNLELRRRVVELEPRLRVRHTVRNGELGLASVLSEFDPSLVNVEWGDFTEGLIRKIHLAGKKAVVNTHGRHDTEFKMKAAIEVGADIIMTDQVDLLATLLRETSPRE